MAKWEDKTVRRDHYIECRLERERLVEDFGKEVEVRYINETYDGQTVSSWVETVFGGKLLQVCSKGTCQTFKLIKQFEPPELGTSGLTSWVCNICDYRRVQKEQRIESNNNYKKEFPKRIMKFSRALKKRYPELNSRKSRNKGWGNCIIVNGQRYSADRELRKKINLVGYEFNIHVDDFYRQDDNDGTDRVRFDVVDISPLFSEHFRDHGHKSVMQERNKCHGK